MTKPVWLTQAQRMEPFQSSKSNISEHIKHFFGEGELKADPVITFGNCCAGFRLSGHRKKFSTAWFEKSMLQASIMVLKERLKFHLDN